MGCFKCYLCNQRYITGEPKIVCGKLTNLQLTACFPFGRPGNMIHESRPAHKECVKDKFGKWSFIKPENKNSGV